ncbi:MAG TPA: glycosyl hydrolase family 65 protein [Nitriliruptorales bacterium]|nr:glycosyl hydrolase family 65 protein [Nitriliruptorales bacterium]
MTSWTLRYEGFDPAQEGLREALCTLGNGYVATRGAAPEATADEVHYPGTYVAGLYNRLSSTVAGRPVENEDLVNLPNWLHLTFRVDDGPWFDLRTVAIDRYQQELDVRRGILTRDVRFVDEEGRATRLHERRFVHLDEWHLAGVETTIAAEDWSGRLTVRSGLDGRVTNSGVPRYRALARRHLEVVRSAATDRTLLLQVRTNQSRVEVAMAARTRVSVDGRPVAPDHQVIDEARYLAHQLTVDLGPGSTAEIEKIVAVHTSRDRGISEAGLAARTAVARSSDFEALLARHANAWDHLWERFRLDVDDDHGDRTQLVTRLHIFHLLQTASPNTMELDVGVPARGWHGEAYRGHIFWDELFAFRFLNLRLPALTRALLLYRCRRLDEARWAARQAGHRGAMYPWQSGSSGREESQVVHLNPRSGRWLPDNSHLQRHINIAVAYNLWKYWEVTGDMAFLAYRAGEVLLEIARFWASIASHDRDDDRYDIRGVVGPDEYHDAYPDADSPGIDNNAYTNVMAAWVLQRAVEMLQRLPEHHRHDLTHRLAIDAAELERWEDISRKLRVCFHDGGVISQFERYETLEELDWESYHRRYGPVMRLDRILEAEGDDVNRYRASKQADVLMLLYLLSEDEVIDLFARLGYALDPDGIQRTIDYYEQRTSHGSTLSQLVHAWVLARYTPDRSWELFRASLEADISDVQGGTTAEGIHLGAMAGTLDLLQRAYSGMVTRSGRLEFDPQLPRDLLHVGYQVDHRGHRLDVELDHARLVVRSHPGAAPPITVVCRGMRVQLEAEGSVAFSL